MSAFIPRSAPSVPLGMDNKGAQMMAKMGWKGAGLGANETVVLILNFEKIYKLTILPIEFGF